MSRSRRRSSRCSRSLGKDTRFRLFSGCCCFRGPVSGRSCSLADPRFLDDRRRGRVNHHLYLSSRSATAASTIHPALPLRRTDPGRPLRMVRRTTPLRGAALTCCLTMFVGYQWEQLVREVAYSRPQDVIIDHRDPERLRKIQDLIPPGKQCSSASSTRFFSIARETRSGRSIFPAWSALLPACRSPRTRRPCELSSRNRAIGSRRIALAKRSWAISGKSASTTSSSSDAKGSVWYLCSIDPNTYVRRAGASDPFRTHDDTAGLHDRDARSPRIT